MTLSHRLTAFRESKLTKLVAILLVVAAVAPFVAFAVPQVAGADTSYIVVSSSMSPTIHANDAILVEDVQPTAVEEGDIIVYESYRDSPGDDKSVTTHRVVELLQTDDGLAYRTKGDALEEVDAQPVPQSSLIGRVSFVIPQVGHVVQFAQSGTGFIALVVVPFGLLILNELWNLAMMLRGPGESRDSSSEGSDPPPETEPTE
jgi:signal peptidase